MRINDQVNTILNSGAIREVKYELYSLRQLLEEVSLTVKDRISIKRIEVVNNYTATEARVLIDVEKMKHALTNIMISLLSHNPARLGYCSRIRIACYKRHVPSQILKIFIKNMVDLRSLVLVETELVKLGLRPVHITMGEADILGDLTIAQRLQLRYNLHQSGLELIENKLDILVYRIKQTITDIVYGEETPVENLSVYLSEKLGYDYTYMSNMFSDAMGITIEKFYICHKVERVKHLLLYEGLTLIEIARRMNYCSSAYLCSQFKKATGKTPSQFKQENRETRPAKAHCG